MKCHCFFYVLKSECKFNDAFLKLNHSDRFLVCFFFFINCSSKNANIDRLRTISKQLDKDIVLLHQSPEHGPILLSWMLMNFQLIELRSDSPEFIRFQQYGTKAAKLGVFTYLHKMVGHPMYRDQSLTALITYQTVFNMLSFMCEIFDNERAITQHTNIFELLCELLKHQTIATKFHSNPESGAQSLFNTAIHNFPVDFIPLSMISHSLTTTSNTMSSYVSNIKPILLQIFIFLFLIFHSDS